MQQGTTTQTPRQTTGALQQMVNQIRTLGFTLTTEVKGLEATRTPCPRHPRGRSHSLYVASNGHYGCTSRGTDQACGIGGVGLSALRADWPAITPPWSPAEEHLVAPTRSHRGCRHAQAKACRTACAVCSLAWVRTMAGDAYRKLVAAPLASREVVPLGLLAPTGHVAIQCNEDHLVVWSASTHGDTYGPGEARVDQLVTDFAQAVNGRQASWSPAWSPGPRTRLRTRRVGPTAGVWSQSVDQRSADSSAKSTVEPTLTPHKRRSTPLAQESP